MFSRSVYTPSDNDSVILMFNDDTQIYDNFNTRSDIIGHVEPELSYRDEITPEDLKLIYDGEPPKTNQLTTLQGHSSRKLLDDLHSIFQSHESDPRCSKCLQCEDCKTLARRTNKSVSKVEIDEDIQIKNSIRFDSSISRYYAELPLKENPDVALSPNIQ